MEKKSNCNNIYAVKLDDINFSKPKEDKCVIQVLSSRKEIVRKKKILVVNTYVKHCLWCLKI